MSHHHNHSHGEGAMPVIHTGVSPDADRGKLTVSLALIVGFMPLEVVVGAVVHSLALLSDAAHMLTDAGAIRQSLVAIRSPPSLPRASEPPARSAMRSCRPSSPAPPAAVRLRNAVIPVPPPRCGRSLLPLRDRGPRLLLRRESGGPGEFHPRAPTDPGVTVSRHRAPLTGPSTNAPAATG